MTAVNGAGLSSAASGFTGHTGRQRSERDLRLGHRRLLHLGFGGGHARQRLRHGLRASTRPAASSSATRLRSTTATAPATPSRARGAASRSSGGDDTTVADRQVLPLPLPALRPRRQPGHVGRQRDAKVDTSAPGAPSLSYGSLSNAIVNLGVVYYLPGAASGAVRGHGRLERRASPASPRTASRPRRPAGAFPDRATRAPTVTPAAQRSGRAERRHRNEQRRPDVGRDELHRDPGRNCAGDFDPVRRRIPARAAGTPTDVSVSLSAVDGGSGLDEIRYTTDGSDPSPINGTVYASAFTISSATTVRFRAYDRLGNKEVVGRQLIQIDSSAPSTSAAAARTCRRLGALERVGHGLLPARRLRLLRPDGNRHRRAVRATQKANFPNVAGFSAGGDDTTVPYSRPYTYTAPRPSRLADGHRRQQRRRHARRRPSPSPPTRRRPAADLRLRRPLATRPPRRAHARQRHRRRLRPRRRPRVVERDEAPLDNGDGTCGTFPGSWSTVTLVGGADTTVASGNCYRYRYPLSDNVGNQATSGASATAKVDTSAPAAPSLSYGSLSNAAVTGDTVYYRTSAASGQFPSDGSLQ